MALVLPVGVVAATPASAEPAHAAAAAQPLRLTLPRPTGHDRIGVVALHLVDRSG